MLDLTVIIPIKTLGKSEEKYFNDLLNSIAELQNGKDLAITFVGTQKAINKAAGLIQKAKLSNASETIETDTEDFAEQINKAVLDCATRYFTVLEVGETLTANWLTSALPFINERTQESTFLTMGEILNKEGKPVYFANEMGWNPSYAEENLGVISEAILKAYPDFHFSGAIIRTDDFLEVHGLKSSMKVAVWYEFALRLLKQKKTIYSIPKIGFRHQNGVNETSGEKLSTDELKWLIETADEESKFTEDRKLGFKGETTEN